MFESTTTNQTIRLPSKKWSIVAVASAGIAAVTLSYLLAIISAVCCFVLPFLLFTLIPIGSGTYLYTLLPVTVFCLVAGLIISWSLLPQPTPFEAKGVLVDLSKERRLAAEIKSIATALHEPMPAEIYLVADANAFVTEVSDSRGKRRVLALGLPLMQMLSISQFRSVLAHEFAHYYAGDTRLGPWVYNTRQALVRVYENLGRKSELMGFLRRWAIISGLHSLLMRALRIYWNIFMRATQAISRRQELRCDELACHIAGSQSLIDGLQGIRRCSVGLNAYWNSFVLPVAMGGYQPDLAVGFQRFMQAPQVSKEISEFAAQAESAEKPSPFDSHPTFSKRVEMARLYNVPVPELARSEPMISLVDDLGPLEDGVLKKVIPILVAAELKPLKWETAAEDVYIPAWRRQIASLTPFLAGKKMTDLPLLILDPRPVAALVSNSPSSRLNQAERMGVALSALSSAFAICLIENGWRAVVHPGKICLEKGESTVDLNGVVGGLRCGALSVVEWKNYRAQRGIGDWPLAVPATVA